MKKLLLLGLALFGTVALTGCDMINSLISGEKEYKYDDYKALLADRKLPSFTVSKCASIIDTDGEKESRNYEYDKDAEGWRYSYHDKDIDIDMNGICSLDIVADVKACELSTAFLEGNPKVDSIYKFYATDKAYRITGEYKTSSVQVKIEYKYREDGLITSKYEKNTNLDAVKTTETTETFSYSTK